MNRRQSPTGRLGRPGVNTAYHTSVPAEPSLRQRLAQADRDNGTRPPTMNGPSARARRVRQQRRDLLNHLRRSMRDAASRMYILAQEGVLGMTALDALAAQLTHGMDDELKAIVEGIATGTSHPRAMDAYWDRKIKEAIAHDRTDPHPAHPEAE